MRVATVSPKGNSGQPQAVCWDMTTRVFPGGCGLSFWYRVLACFWSFRGWRRASSPAGGRLPSRQTTLTQQVQNCIMQLGFVYAIQLQVTCKSSVSQQGLKKLVHPAKVHSAWARPTALTASHDFANLHFDCHQLLVVPRL